MAPLTDGTDHLRVLIANDRNSRLALAPIITSPGHEVIAQTPSGCGWCPATGERSGARSGDEKLDQDDVGSEDRVSCGDQRADRGRRGVRVSLTTAGGELVAEVSRRRVEIAVIVERIRNAHRRPVLNVLRAFAEAAGEVAEQDWSLGWDL